MPDTTTGRILSISSRGRITLDVGGRLVLGQLLDGGGGWVGDHVEGGMTPGVQAWRHPGSDIVSHVQVLLSESAMDTSCVDVASNQAARAA